jgi:uncharacterized RDD family membrane protein YckC
MRSARAQLDRLEQIDNIVEIVTPENIAFQYRFAGPFRRFVALLVDATAKAIAMYVLVILLGIVAISIGDLMEAFISSFAVIFWFVLSWFYSALFETYWNGRTPGKWVLGIRVLSASGQPINGMQATLRAILKEADMLPAVALGHILPDLQELPIAGLPVPLFFVGLLTMMLSRCSRRLGDLVAGTMVVVDEKSWLAGVSKLDDPRTPYLAELIPADFQVSRSLGQALSMYVERRRYFTEGRRREVARHLGEPLVKQFGLPSDTSWDLLLCALYHRAFIADPGEIARRNTQENLPFGWQRFGITGPTANSAFTPGRGIAETASSILPANTESLVVGDVQAVVVEPTSVTIEGRRSS